MCASRSSRSYIHLYIHMIVPCRMVLCRRRERGGGCRARGERWTNTRATHTLVNIKQLTTTRCDEIAIWVMPTGVRGARCAHTQRSCAAARTGVPPHCAHRRMWSGGATASAASVNVVERKSHNLGGKPSSDEQVYIGMRRRVNRRHPAKVVGRSAALLCVLLRDLRGPEELLGVHLACAQ